MHCQNADWATRFLLHKFNITAQDSLVGTDFGKYVKYKRPERRGGPYAGLMYDADKKGANICR